MGIMECLLLIAKVVFLIFIFSVISLYIDEFESKHFENETSEDETTDTDPNKWHW